MNESSKIQMIQSFEKLLMPPMTKVTFIIDKHQFNGECAAANLPFAWDL